jgi:hypothetical protein
MIIMIMINIIMPLFLFLGGELCTIIFPLSDIKVGGPPYAMSFQLLKSLLGVLIYMYICIL